MSFALPAGLMLGLVAIPIGILYLLKIKRHRRDVPYLRLWEQLVAERQFTSLFRKLQKWLSLLLQLLILTCVVLAFASLTLSDSFLREDSVVLVIDTSASMQGATAPDDPTPRWESAAKRARELVEGRSAEDRYAIVMAGAAPQVLQGFTRSTLRLREALDKLAPTAARGDLDAAVRLSEDLLAGAEHPAVVLLSDAAGAAAAGAAAPAPAAAAEGEEAAPPAAVEPIVHWLPICESVDNVAIRRFQVRRNTALGTDDLLLVVANQSEAAREVEIEIGIGGQLRTVIPLQLEAGAVESVHRDLGAPLGGFLSARISAAAGEQPAAGASSDEGAGGGEAAAPTMLLTDGLAMDDVAWAAIAPAQAYKVLLVTRDELEQAPFLAALEALGPLIDRERTGGITPAEWPNLSDELIASYDLVVFVNEVPAELPDFGRYLCLNALPGDVPAKPVGIETAPVIEELDREHPMNRFLDARALRPPGGRPVDTTGGDVFLATAAGPVGVVFDRDERRVVYLGLDMLADLFYLRMAFPVVLRNALAWMDEEATQLLPPTLRPGEPLRPRFALPGGVESVKVRWATGNGEKPVTGELDVAVQEGRFNFTETWQPGRYTVQVGDQTYLTTVNLFDEAESDLRVPDPPENVEAPSFTERSGFIFGRDLWPLLTLAAGLLWAMEWLLFHRRITE